MTPHIDYPMPPKGSIPAHFGTAAPVDARVSLMSAVRLMAGVLGAAAPTYQQLYIAVKYHGLPARKSATGRWSVARADLPKIARHFGLIYPADTALRPARAPVNHSDAQLALMAADAMLTAAEARLGSVPSAFRPRAVAQIAGRVEVAADGSNRHWPDRMADATAAALDAVLKHRPQPRHAAQPWAAPPPDDDDDDESVIE